MLECLPCDDVNGHWQVQEDMDADDKGWTYGTTFQHLCFPRDGGRATKRSTDLARRRVWRRCPSETHGNVAYALNAARSNKKIK